MKNLILIVAIFWTFSVLLFTVNVSEQVNLLQVGKFNFGINNDYKALLLRFSIVIPWLLLLWTEKK